MHVVSRYFTQYFCKYFRKFWSNKLKVFYETINLSVKGDVLHMVVGNIEHISLLWISWLHNFIERDYYKRHSTPSYLLARGERGIYNILFVCETLWFWINTQSIYHSTWPVQSTPISRSVNYNLPTATVCFCFAAIL